MPLPASWQAALEGELEKPYFKACQAFVEKERAAGDVFPPADEVFTAFALTPYEKVRVLLLGQDPYHDVGQAHGLAFSVKPGVKPPPSLANIYKELESDLGIAPARHGHLVPWAQQGVLMLNAVLTVRAHAPGSHEGQGWESFTDAVIRKVNARSDRVVFVLWGGHARKKAQWIDRQRHAVIEGPHPSPLSAYRGFLGSRPFSTINQLLREAGKDEVDWRLPLPLRSR